MTTALERLRASKEEYEVELKASAETTARAWVDDEAAYGDLVRVAKIRLERGMDVSELLTGALDPNGELTTEELASHLGLEEADLSDNDFLWHFIVAVQDREIANKI